MDMPDNLQSQMAGKTDEQLLSMFQRPEDWLPETLAAARAELGRRNLSAETMAAAPSAGDEAAELPAPTSEPRVIDYRRQAHLGIPFGYILQLFGGALLRFETNVVMFYGEKFLVLAGVGLVIWGCAGYAAGKGYPKWLGALGLLSCLGVFFLILLPDRRKEYDDHTS